MMNLMALCLVVTSLATAGVWSPTPENKHNKELGEDVIVKEGHRIIVVEYDQDGHRNTKVSISSPEQDHHVSISDVGEDISSNAKGVVENAKDKIKEASSVLPNLGQGLSQESSQSDETERHTPRELICDAFGKCKHKIATVIGKAKHEVSEAAQEEAEAVGEALGKAKETVSEKVHRVEESVEEAEGKLKTAGKNIVTNVSEKVEVAKEEVAEKAKEAKETAKSGAEKLKKESKKEMNEIIKYMKMKSTEAMDSLMGVLNLLGLATAYGMCVWVTFISSHILAVAMQRQQFGMVQSKIYPVYFRAMAYCIGMALFGHLLGNRKKLLFSTSKAEMFQVYNLWASLLMVFANSLYLEPRATKVMFERMKMEKEEGRGRGRGRGREELLADELSSRAATATEAQSVAADPAATSTTAAAPSLVPEGSEKEREVVRSRIGRLNERLKKLNIYSSFLNILTLMALTWHLVYLAQRLHLTC